MQRVHFFGRNPHYISTIFRDKGQPCVFLPCLFPCHHPHKDKVSREFFNLFSFNWWEKVVSLISALSWRDLIRSNDQISGEFWVRIFGDWMVWRGLCCYISLYSLPWLRPQWKEKQGTNKSQMWMLLVGKKVIFAPWWRRRSEQSVRWEWALKGMKYLIILPESFSLSGDPAFYLICFPDFLSPCGPGTFLTLEKSHHLALEWVEVFPCQTSHELLLKQPGPFWQVAFI